MINEKLLEECRNKNIDVNRLISNEINRINTRDLLIERLENEHNPHKVQHCKFIELYRKGMALETPIDIYNELYKDIIKAPFKGSPFNALIQRIANFSKKYTAIFGYFKDKRDINEEDEYDGNSDTNGRVPNISWMKGMIFEIFIEKFSKILESDEDFPYRNYLPNDREGEDNGVDGFGISNLDNKLTTIQLKYISDIRRELLERNIKQFPWQSTKKYGVPIDTYGNMVIVTSCKGLSYYTDDEVFLNCFNILNGEFLKNKTTNYAFWDNLSVMVYDTLRHELTAEEKEKLIKINTIKNR